MRRKHAHARSQPRATPRIQAGNAHRPGARTHGAAKDVDQGEGAVLWKTQHCVHPRAELKAHRVQPATSQTGCASGLLSVHAAKLEHHGQGA